MNTHTIDLRVNIAGVELSNPVMTCSGTFGSGKEYSEFMNLGDIGAVVCKGVSTEPWNGNPAPRIAEVANGILNSVGLQNPGVEAFIAHDIPFLRTYGTKIVANLAGHGIEEYVSVAERLNEADVDMMELNISCPNVKEGGATFGTDATKAAAVTGAVRKVCTKPLIVKLSPNVTDITEIARAVEASGADAVSLINTIVAMKIDIYRRRPVLAQKFGGMSGPAIKPIAVRMVYQVARAVRIPVIGMGGIATAEDALEFLFSGASAIGVGASHFHNPYAAVEVLEGIRQFMISQGFSSIREINEALIDS